MKTKGSSKKQGKLDVQSLSEKINKQLKDMAEQHPSKVEWIVLRYRDIYTCMHPRVSLPVQNVERYHLSKTALQIAVLDKPPRVLFDPAGRLFTPDTSSRRLRIWKYVLDAELESGGKRKTVVQCAGSSKGWVRQVSKDFEMPISYMRFIGDDEKMLLLLSPLPEAVNPVVPGYKDYVYNVETGALCNDVARDVISAGIDDSFKKRQVDYYEIGRSKSMSLCLDQRNIDISASSLKVQDRATIEDIAGYLIKNAQ